MLLRLPILLKPRLKLPLLRRNDQQSHIRLTCPSYHVGHIVFMTRSIKQRKTVILERETHLSIFPSFAINPLLRDDVRYTSLLPSLHLVVSRILLGLSQLLLIYLLQFLDNIASKGRLARINMAYKDDIHILLG